EHNFALYSSLAYNIGKWSFKGGLRAEMTDLEGIVSEPYELEYCNTVRKRAVFLIIRNTTLRCILH
ncbi:outer membrane beta-barrel protein, partial [Chryseobacterium sp. CH1]|uniref:outer membrane beta-barrel protein n=1 Tax=Chryseobacterium sp. CH1 TaxID=713551 RepID=UPI0013E92641